MRINHNLASLNTYNRLTVNQENGSKSLEKLSSGLRINRAGDDAAGLAISEKMRAQVRGLDQASRNSQDGISMIQTAEGALNETQSILQRMRELATQASNDTNVGVDRGQIQQEMNQLTSEINRIGNTTEFNTQKLLKGDDGIAFTLDKTSEITDGTLTGGSAAVLTNAHVTFTVSGATATAVTGGQTLTFYLNGQQLNISFVTDASTGTTGAVTGVNGTSAAINVQTGGTSNDAAALIRSALTQMIANNSVLAGNYTVSGTNADVSIVAATGGAFEGAAGLIATAVDGGTIFAVAPAANTGTTTAATYASMRTTFTTTVATAGQASALLGKGFTINGKTVEFYNANNGSYTGSADFAVNISNALSPSTGNTAAGELVKDIVSQLGSQVSGVTFATATGGTDDLSIRATTAGTDGNSINVADGVTKTKGNFSATFQVGANMNQSFTIDIGDMRANALGITGSAGATGFTSANTVTDGTNSTLKEAALDVSTFSNATSAIDVINTAIQNVSSQRAKLGAFQNRLEHTINNLGTSSENLTAAESRIRDVDMAKEMMEFTKNNILTQAAQGMLAQANQAPQGVLQLLR